MMRAFFLFFAALLVTSVKGQTLFSNSFGDPKNPAIIFMHGGPGYNPVSFELGAADKLAAEGFYVITFDQRGCGRSKKDSVTDHYKFNNANNDILTIMKKYALEKAFFIGHSWGGTEAIKFGESYPEKMQGLILVGSPLNYQLGFKAILEHCEKKLQQKKDSTALKQLRAVRTLDTTKLEYSSMCFAFAMSCGLYTPANPTAERGAIYDEMKKSKKADYLSNMTGNPVYGFYMNEQYTTLDLTYYVKKLIDKKIPVYGLFGKEDGLFNRQHFDLLQKTLGQPNLVLVDNASHNVFIDQRDIFLKQVKKWASPIPETAPVKKGKK